MFDPGTEAKQRGVKRKHDDAHKWLRFQARAKGKATAKGRAKAKAKAAGAAPAPVAGAVPPAPVLPAPVPPPPAPPPPAGPLHAARPMRVPARAITRAGRGENTELFGTSWTLAKVQLSAMLKWFAVQRP